MSKQLQIWLIFFIKQLLEKIQNYCVSLGSQHRKLKFANRKNHNHNNPVLRILHIYREKYLLSKYQIGRKYQKK